MIYLPRFQQKIEKLQSTQDIWRSFIKGTKIMCNHNIVIIDNMTLCHILLTYTAAESVYLCLQVVLYLYFTNRKEQNIL